MVWPLLKVNLYLLYLNHTYPGLTISFQSGITLLDTPGVGESKLLTKTFMDYVEKHDEFGFIFVMKCNDAGGILSRVSTVTTGVFKQFRWFVSIWVKRTPDPIVFSESSSSPDQEL